MEKQNSILLHFIALQVARMNFTANALSFPQLSWLRVSLLPFFVQISSDEGSLLEKGLLCGGGKDESVLSAGSVAPIP